MLWHIYTNPVHTLLTHMHKIHLLNPHYFYNSFHIPLSHSFFLILFYSTFLCPPLRVARSDECNSRPLSLSPFHNRFSSLSLLLMLVFLSLTISLCSQITGLSLSLSLNAGLSLSYHLSLFTNNGLSSLPSAPCQALPTTTRKTYGSGCPSPRTS